ncbi:MAG: permease, partial [Muribaculaceae bacterium]|nr:permease [Muribaculaceae bacterium]
ARFGAAVGGLAVDRADRDGATDPAAFEEETAGKMPRAFGGKLLEAVRYGLVDMVASVGKWLVIGLVVAALITVFVPDELFVRLSAYPVVAMLLMVVVAVPMYVCATGSIPIALSLMLKGLTPGVAFVLLMAGPAANFASVMVIGRAMGRKATAVYVGSVVLTAILFGLAIDYLLPASWFLPAVTSLDPACHHGLGLFESVCSAVLVGLLVYAAVKSRSRRHAHCHCGADECPCATAINNTTNNTHMIPTNTYKIEGMACNHCRMTVEKALTALPGATDVNVDLSKGTATVTGAVDPAAVEKAVLLAGFSFGGALPA